MHLWVPKYFWKSALCWLPSVAHAHYGPDSDINEVSPIYTSSEFSSKSQIFLAGAVCCPRSWGTHMICKGDWLDVINYSAMKGFQHSSLPPCNSNKRALTGQHAWGTCRRISGQLQECSTNPLAYWIHQLLYVLLSPVPGTNFVSTLITFDRKEKQMGELCTVWTVVFLTQFSILRNSDTL